MASDVMSVRLWLPRIKVEGVVVDAPEELVVRVCSTVRRPRCPDCGVPSGKVHDRRDNKIRDLEVSGRPVTLIWERRRLVCEPCGSRFSEGHQGFEGRVTARLARRLVKDARAMTVNAAAKTPPGELEAGELAGGRMGGAGRRAPPPAKMPGAAGGRDLDPQTAPLRDGDRQRRHRRGARHGAPPRHPGAQRVPGRPRAPMVQSREGRRLRRLGGVQSSDRGAARPRPPRPGPVPRHQMVPSRAGRGPPRRPAPPRRLQARFRPRRVPGEIPADAQTRQARRRRPGPP